MVTEPPRQRAPEPVMASAFEEEEPIEDDLLAAAMREEQGGGADHAGGGGAEGGNPFDRIAEMMMEQPPAPVPDLFSSPMMEREPRRRGALGLIVLAIILILLVAGIVLYFFQDQIISHYPAAAKLYDQAHVRNEVVGAGLLFRDYSSERAKDGDTEVLVVRGVIANTTDRARPIPLLRLALYDGSTQVQEKVIDPPQTTLDGGGTVGFKITLEQPDPHATRFEVTFAGKKTAGETGAKPAEPAK